jgi:hypothetical protein
LTFRLSLLPSFLHVLTFLPSFIDLPSLLYCLFLPSFLPSFLDLPSLTFLPTAAAATVVLVEITAGATTVVAVTDCNTSFLLLTTDYWQVRHWMLITGK